MKTEKIQLVESGYFSQYWLQYKEDSVLPDYRVIFSELIRNIHNFSLGKYYWNLGSIPESRIVGAGGALEELTGHNEKEWLGSPPAFSLQHFLPGDVPYVMAYVMKFDQYIKQLPPEQRGNARATIYARIIVPGGTVKWFCVQYPGVYCDENGRLIYILAVCSDISHLKSDDRPPFMSILDTARGEQQTFLCHSPDSELRPQQASPRLSEREREIIALLAKGMSSKQISGLLFISKSTVDNHRQNLLKKLDTTSTAGIIHRALEMGLL